MNEEEVWLTPSGVARLFAVDPKTVTRWFKSGKLGDVRYITTPGGQRRYYEGDLLKIRDRR